jgi:hypothetical protein
MIPASFPSDPVEPRAMQPLLALQSSHSFHNPTTRGICIAFIARRLRHILGPPSPGNSPSRWYRSIISERSSQKEALS